MLKNGLILLLVFITIFLLNRSCEKERHFDNTMTILNNKVQYHKTSKGQVVAEKQFLETTTRQIKKDLDSLKEITRRYKKIKNATIIKQEVRIDTVVITYTDTIPYVFKRSFKLTKPDYIIGGKITHKALHIDSIIIPNVITVITGVKKGWDHDIITTEVVNSNPYINTINISTHSEKIKTRRFGLGIFMGVNVLGKASVGVGLTYNVIRF